MAVALFVSHYAPKRLAVSFGYFIDLLAAIPSVVFGLWGIAVLAPILSRSVYPWLEDNLGFLPFFAGPASTSGRTMMTVAVVLAVMILPIITAISREVFLQTPRLHEEASLALGATKWEMIRQAVLPYGRSGVISGAMLGLGRALGETMAVAIILSPANIITVNVISNQNPNTIAANIALKFPESAGLQRQSADRHRPRPVLRDLHRQRVGTSDRQHRILGSGRMTLTEQRPAPTEPSSSITANRMTRVQVGAVGLVAVAVGALSWLSSGSPNWARWIVVTLVTYCVGIYIVARIIEGRRQALDRLMLALVTSAFALVVMPLASVIWTVIERGTNRFDAEFFTETMRGVTGEGGGIYHAIIGTLIVTGLATLMSVPFGLFTAIYLAEYGHGTKLAKAIQSMVDVMTGIPSIVAGLFAYAMFELIFGPGTRSGIAGAVALTVLMTPVVVRSSEEMLRLVPNELREASYALGVPKWKTIVKVVLPTAIAGIITGVVLAIARVIGETAPLLVTAGLAQGVNWNPFDGRMTTLPVFTYYQYVQPGVPPSNGQDRAWAAALVLIIIVMVLFTLARILAHVLKPKGLR